MPQWLAPPFGLSPAVVQVVHCVSCKALPPRSQRGCGTHTSVCRARDMVLPRDEQLQSCLVNPWVCDPRASLHVSLTAPGPDSHSSNCVRHNIQVKCFSRWQP